MRILMVCLGNICRSPLAEGILSHKTKNLQVQVDSAGTAGYHIGSPPDPRSIKIADKYNIDLSSQRARKFSRADFNNFDIIYREFHVVEEDKLNIKLLNKRLGRMDF